MTYIVRNTAVSQLIKRDANCTPIGRNLDLSSRWDCADGRCVDRRLSNKEVMTKLTSLLDELAALKDLAGTYGHRTSGYDNSDLASNVRYDRFLNGLANLPGKRGAYDAGFVDGYDTGVERGLAAAGALRSRDVRGKRVAYDKGFRDGYGTGLDDGIVAGRTSHKRAAGRYNRHLGRDTMIKGYHQQFAHVRHGFDKTSFVAQEKDFGFFNWFKNNIGDANGDKVVNQADIQAWLKGDKAI